VGLGLGVGRSDIKWEFDDDIVMVVMSGVHITADLYKETFHPENGSTVIILTFLLRCSDCYGLALAFVYQRNEPFFKRFVFSRPFHSLILPFCFCAVLL
jgi:hypothetical protein